MTKSPVKAIEGTPTGDCCDGCNRGLRDGDRIRLYATFYDEVGWDVRRVYCRGCCSDQIESETRNADELIAEAVFFWYRIIGVEILDRSFPEEGVI